MAVEHIRLSGKVSGTCFQEKAAGIGIVGQIETDLVTDSILTELTVHSLHDLEIGVRVTDVSIGLIERSHFPDALISFVFNEIPHKGREAGCELVRV
jgi:hypothetical protein